MLIEIMTLFIALLMVVYFGSRIDLSFLEENAQKYWNFYKKETQSVIQSKAVVETGFKGAASLSSKPVAPAAPVMRNQLSLTRFLKSLGI